jgi:hypothetical protein
MTFLDGEKRENNSKDLEEHMDQFMELGQSM